MKLNLILYIRTYKNELNKKDKQMQQEFVQLKAIYLFKSKLKYEFTLKTNQLEYTTH